MVTVWVRQPRGSKTDRPKAVVSVRSSWGLHSDIPSQEPGPIHRNSMNKGGSAEYLDAIVSIASEGPDFENRLQFMLAVLKPPALQFAPKDNLVERLTVSEESLGLARKWIDDCRVKHVSCREKSTAFRPTRLVSIGVDHVEQLRLCMGEDIDPDASYFTFSHCWGTEPMPERLLKENIQSRFSHIDYNKLPLNFQDAISAVKQLGGRYLWVDSLCIVQDSMEDWQHESGLMGQVYLNGCCNLSAIASESSSVGMVFERDPLDILPFRTTIGVEHNEEVVYICDPSIWQKGVDDSPLIERAWVCQERLLSACNLHFGKTQLLWECGTLTASETFPQGIPFQLQEFRARPLIKRNGSQFLRSPSGPNTQSLDDALHPIQLWDKTVELYSKCQLTYGSDKLLAIAGLAAISHDKFTQNGGKYFAGLWQEYLQYQLLWSGSALSRYPTRPAYRAPTWSWASVDGPVTMHETTSLCTSLMEIIDTHVDLVSKNPYGQVKGGYIRVKCALTPARVDHFKEFLAPTVFKRKAAVLCSWDYPAELNLGDESEIFYLLPVCAGTSSAKPESHQRSERDHTLTGLILAKAKDNSGDFTRCGIFESLDDDGVGDLTESCRLFANDAVGSGLTLSDEYRGGMGFVVRII
ncbi:hypothetical protein GP486_003819 [Trichoglossum hirsutum]|uniref:Heterokaryon incompatibility domain-containing protein n=1 Tax=Trichoglossum hirsutum TaxID=265104 RepID=A0A9P8LCB5_9PEZI|nr:hypothetical protein GP486_003819 [Trichoglossum hirsutum]